MKLIEDNYIKLISSGSKPQEARSILPNSIKTEIVMTMNLREWRHFLKLRTDKAAHPQMREVAIQILDMFKEKIPVIFDDIQVNQQYINNVYKIKVGDKYVKIQSWG